MPNDAATRKSQNIKRSVQDYLEAQALTWRDQEVASPTYGQDLPVPKLYDGTFEQVPARGAWVDVIWRKRTPTPMAAAQRMVTWIVELQCWSRIEQDPTMAILDALADQLIEAFKDGERDKRIPLNDYADIDLPADSGYTIRLENLDDDYLPSTDLVYGRYVLVKAHYIERY